MKRKKHKSIYFLIFVLMLLSGIVFFQISEAYTKTLEKEQELETLNNELVSELERKVELEEMEYYIQSDEFIIKKARNEFNLIQEGEILFITEE
jgi:cell division protein FtsB